MPKGREPDYLNEIMIRLVELVKEDKPLHDAVVNLLNAKAEALRQSIEFCKWTMEQKKKGWIMENGEWRKREAK